MNCVDWEERVALYAGGDLAAVEAQAVERHVAECSACQVLLSGLRGSLALVREAHAEPVEAAHLAAVRARVLAELERAPAGRWRFAWVPALAAALVVLAVAICPRPDVRLAMPMPQAPVARPVARTVLPPHRKTAARPRPLAKREQQPAEPMVVKLLTDDPNVVIYWITDTKGEMK
jgi:anti-sigma factor RsiW